MLRTTRKEVRKKIEDYLIESAFNYVADCLKKEEPTKEEIKKFVADEVKRVESYRKQYGIIPHEAVIDYLQGLSLAIDYSYYDIFKVYTKWTDNPLEWEKATEKQVEDIEKKYWHVLALEIERWMN